MADVQLPPLRADAALQLSAEFIAVALVLVKQREESVVDGHYGVGC